MGQLRTCLVSFVDPNSEGFFTVKVEAASKYEAAAKALFLFRREPWCQESLEKTALFELTLEQPAPPTVKYRVRLRDFETWLEQSGGSPKDVALRNELRKLLGV